MTARVYIPATLGALAQYLEEGGIGPSPVGAHAVTEWLQESWPEAAEEEWAYAALMAAADDSLALLATSEEGDRPRRVVIVAEVARVTEDRESTAVTVDAAIALRLVQAVHADTEDVDPSSPDDLDDLGWFAAQEIPDLLT